MILLRAFKTYIRPLLEYGTVIFCPHKRKVSDKLEKVQNSFTRKLFIRKVGFFYDKIPSFEERNMNLGLHSLSWRRRKFDLLMFHKMIHGHTGLDPENYFSFRPSITRGGSRKLCLPRARLKCRSNFFINRAGSDYLALSRVQAIPSSLRSFKNTLRNYLKS